MRKKLTTVWKIVRRADAGILQSFCWYLPDEYMRTYVPNQWTDPVGKSKLYAFDSLESAKHMVAIRKEYEIWKAKAEVFEGDPAGVLSSSIEAMNDFWLAYNIGILGIGNVFIYPGTILCNRIKLTKKVLAL